MENNKLIYGAGGGGGDSSHTPVEAQDNVRSKQIARFVDVLAEGEIVGLVDGLKSVYLNETPVLNDDGSYNFADVSLYTRSGTVYQDPVPDMIDTEFEVGVNAEVKAATPITRTLSNVNVSAVRVTLAFPQMTEQNMTNGDLNGSHVALKVQVQSNGAGFVDVINDTVTCKTTSRYQRSYTIQLSGTGPWDIRVVRLTPDSTSASVVNKFLFDSFTGIIPVKLAYPNTALIAMRMDAANFSSIPGRAYRIKGMIIKVPSNYDPATRAYSGTWNGSFKLAWSDNPAWCFYDMLTNDRYGLGRWVNADQIDKWALYGIAQYCDQLVPNGRGGTEPRFTCNLYLQSREEAYNVIQNMASIFRAITYWSAGTIYTVQDRPYDPVAQFTPANVIDGAFTYSGSSLKARHTVALVSWNDPTDFYRQKVEYVQDDELVSKYGVIETQVTGFGCASQSQAHRLGRWMLATERYASETVTFRTSLDGLMLYPGAVIVTSDPTRAGTRMGGRILAFAAGAQQSITIDQAFTAIPGHTYRLTISMPDGKLESHNIALSQISDDGASTVITPVGPFSTTPVAGAIWLLTDLNVLVPEQWRVTALVEGDPGTVDVTALSYVPDLYDSVETGISIDAPPISSIKGKPATPQNLAATVSQYRVDGQITGLRASLSWTSDVGRYRVSWRRTGTQWQSREVDVPMMELDSVDPVVYDFMVVAINAIGRESSAALLSIDLKTLVNQTIDAMPAPTNLRLLAPYVRQDAVFGWDAVPGALGYQVQLSKTDIPFAGFRSELVGDTLRYRYTPVDMKADGGPFRTITIRVRAYTVFNTFGSWATLTVGNPQVGPLQGISVNAGIGTIFFQCDEPADDDFSGIMIWLGTTPTFTPNDSTLAYTGFGTYAVFNALPDGSALKEDTTYYVRAAGFDAIGKDNLSVSPSIATLVYGKAPDLDSIIAGMIKDGALTATKFADGIEPVGIYDSLPAVAGYTGPKTINVDGTLYSLENGVWTAPTAIINPGSIDLEDLSGALQGSIGKIDGPETTPGTVANQIATKVKEVADLAAEDTEWYGSLAQTALAAAQFAVKAQTTASSAQIARSEALVARLGDDISAAVYSETLARTTSEEAIAQRIDGLSVTWGADINAAVESERQARVTADQATATAIDGLTAKWQQDIDAAVTSERQARVSADQATATTIDGLTAKWKLDINASITQYDQTVASANYASATSVSTLSSTVSGHTTTINQQATTLNGVKARVEVKIDNNGVISGYALDSTTDRNGAPTSAMIFAVDKFQIKGTGAAPFTPFLVDTTDNSVKISGTSIKDGTLTAAKIVANSITTAQIAAGAIKSDQIAAGAITTDMIVIGTAGGIPGTLIKDGAISTNKIAAASITADHLTANSVAATAIAVNSITTDKIAANAVTANKIDSRGLSIKDESGNVVLSATSALDWSKVAGANKPQDNANYTTKTSQLNDDAQLGKTADWTKINGMLTNISQLSSTDEIKNTKITLQSDGTLSGGGGGKVTLAGIGYMGSLWATENTGAFANLNGQITASNAADFFAANSLSGTYIQNLAADKILAGTLGAGVIYAGSIEAGQISAGTMVGQTIYSTNNTAGQRLALNASGSNALEVYGPFNTLYASIGGYSASYNIYSIGVMAFSGNGSSAAIYCAGSMQVNRTATMCDVIPAAVNSYNLGWSDMPWSNIYVSTAPHVVSDVREKLDIQDSDLGLDFVMQLRPISYRLKVGRTEVMQDPDVVGPFLVEDTPTLTSVYEGTRRHYGLPAQNVKEALGDRDAGIWCLSDTEDADSKQSLRYEELISPMIKAIQELNARVDALAQENAELRTQLQSIANP